MKKQTPLPPNDQLWRILGTALVTLVIIASLAALSIWVLWPVRQKSLQTIHVQHFSFASAKVEVD